MNLLWYLAVPKIFSTCLSSVMGNHGLCWMRVFQRKNNSKQNKKKQKQSKTKQNKVKEIKNKTKTNKQTKKQSDLIYVLRQQLITI